MVQMPFVIHISYQHLKKHTIVEGPGEAAQEQDLREDSQAAVVELQG